MTDTIPTHTMTTTTMTAVVTLSVAACIPATVGEFVPSKFADEHMLTGKTRRLNPAGLSCDERGRQLRRPYSSIRGISPVALAAKFAIVCHSIANSSQSRFAVGSDASLARCLQASAFIRYVSDRLWSGM